MQVTLSPSINFQKSYQKTTPAINPTQMQTERFIKISPALFQAYYSINPIVNYTYKPISPLRPDFEILNCEYEDIDEFSELFAEKINSQLMTPTKKDIENLIKRIKIKTNADEKTIKEVLYELTQFSSYNSLSSIEKMAKNEDTLIFGLDFKKIHSKPIDFSTNACLNYLGNSKHQFNLKGSFNHGFILDEYSIKQLEKFKNSTSSENNVYNEFVESLKREDIGRTRIFNIKGWDIKCSDGKYRSANMFQGSGYLEDLAVDILKRISKGETLDDILYSDFDERLKELLKDDIDTYDLEIIHHSGKKLNREINSSDILKNLSPKKVTKERIQDVLEYFVDKTLDSETHKKEEKFAIFSKYLDEQSIVYSIDSMCFELIKLHEKIKNKAKKEGIQEDKITLHVNETQNSHVLMTHMYAKANGIDFDNISCRPNILYEVEDAPENEKNVAVILDDISASGDTQSNDWNALLRQRKYVKNPNPIYLATLINTLFALKSMSGNIDDECLISNHTVKDFGFSDPLEKIYDIKNNPKYAETFKKAYEIYCQENFELISPEDFAFLYESLIKGYKNNSLSCIFPYMIPDNCSDLSAVLFDNLLHKSNAQSNKPLNDIENINLSTLNQYKVFLETLK